MHIRIGTRGSRLALWQADHVKSLLEKAGATAENVIIETKGDKILDRSLSSIGAKGLFTEELEEKLRTGEIDIAVHSAKDVQSSLDDDLELIAFTERERVNDVLLSFDPQKKLSATESFIVGTSSVRRVAFLRHFYPHLNVVNMRGNLQTRLKKMEEGVCDALLLAFAGVHRMGYNDLITEVIGEKTFIPAVGQGSVAVECARALDSGRKALIRSAVNHPDTETGLLAERAFLKKVQGGCSVPVFALSEVSGGTLTLRGGVISLDGRQLLTDTRTGVSGDASSLGNELADVVLAKGGREILDEIKRTRTI